MLRRSVDHEPLNLAATPEGETSRSPAVVELVEPFFGGVPVVGPVGDDGGEIGDPDRFFGRDLTDRGNEGGGLHGSRPGSPPSRPLSRSLVSFTFLRSSSDLSSSTLSSVPPTTSLDTSLRRGLGISGSSSEGEGPPRLATSGRGLREPSRASARRSLICSWAPKYLSRLLSRASPALLASEPRSSLPLRGASRMPTRAPTAPPSTKVLSRCLSTTALSLWAFRDILPAFRAGDGDPLPRRAGVKEHRGRPPAGLLGYPRDPVGHDLHSRVGGVLDGDVLHRLYAGPRRALEYVVVDLAYLPEVGDVLLCRAAHRRSQGPDIEARPVDVLLGEVNDQRADVRVVAVAVEDDLGYQVHPLDDEVGPFFEPPVNDGLDPDRHLGGLLPETVEDYLVLLDRHPQILALYLVGALVQQGEEIGAYGPPQDLPYGVRAHHALDVQAPRHVGGQRARANPRRPPDKDHDGLGRFAQDAPLVQPAHHERVLRDQLVPDPGKDLFLFDRVELLGQKLGADLARYLVGQLRARPGLGQRLGQDPPRERRLPAPLDDRDLPLFHCTLPRRRRTLIAEDAEAPVLPPPPLPDAVEEE